MTISICIEVHAGKETPAYLVGVATIKKKILMVRCSDQQIPSVNFLEFLGQLALNETVNVAVALHCIEYVFPL